MAFQPLLHLCHFCQGCFPSQQSLGLHLIDHNRLRALEAAAASQPPVSPPVLPPMPPPLPPASVSVESRASSAFVPPLPPPPVVASNFPPALTVETQPSVSPPPPPPLPVAPEVATVAVPVVAPTTPPARVAVPPGMARGEVAYYNVKRFFGTIKRAVPGEKVHFYLTACNVQTPTVTIGEKVFFAERKGPKGPIATSVVRTLAGGSAGTVETNSASFVPGTVKRYEVKGAFGTIATDNGEELSFHVHLCNVLRPPPTIGERVKVRLGVSPKGPVAKEVRRHVPGQPGGTIDKSKAKHKTGVNTPTKKTRPTQSVSQAERIAQQTRELLQEVPSTFNGGKHPRYVYVDLDNIWVSFSRAEHLVGKFPGAVSTRDLVLHLEGLSRRLSTGEEGSTVARLVAFYYKTPPTIANGLRKFSHHGVAWEVRKQETASDTTMQLELLNAKRPCEAHPKTLVLVTGDGNIAPNGMCFREILDQYLRDGWHVEVHAWLATMARSYIEFQREYPSTVVIRPLDNDLEEVVMPRKMYDARLSKANSTSSSSTSSSDDSALIPAIVTKYEVVGGLGTVTKLDGSGGELHLSILTCDIKRPPPTIGERVMVTEGVSKKWGPITTTVRRITIAADTESVAVGESTSEPFNPPDNEIETDKTDTANNSAALGAAPVSQLELSAALNRAMDMMTVDPNAANSNRGDQAFHADEYEDLVRLLSDPDEGEQHLSAAIALLEQTHPEEAATIQDMDPATQRILLLDVFQGEVDGLELTDVGANLDGVEFDAEHRGISAPPSSPVGSPKHATDKGSPLMHPEPEPAPSEVMGCEICAVDVPVDDMVLVSGCDHAFCRHCLRNYAVNRVDREDVSPRCPVDDCAFALSDVDLARVLSIEEQKKYYDMRTQLSEGGAPEAPTSL